MKTDGLVNVDSPFARAIGFTSDKFIGYGWRSGQEFYLSVISSKQEGQGHFRVLVQTLLDQGVTVKVPTPFPRMKMILERLEFCHTIEQTAEYGPCEVWVKRPSLLVNGSLP